MGSVHIKVGIIATSAETRELLRMQVNATGLAAAEVEADQYCIAYGDRLSRRFVESRPDIILVDMEDPPAAIQTLNILHAALPETWLFVSSELNDPQLIIETMRAGAREFLSKPIAPRNLSQALSRYAAEKQRRLERKGVGRLYCVTSAKGGAGATSVAINIAACLTETPKTRVALIDLNSPVGDVAAQLNLQPQFSVSDTLAAASRLDSLLLESFMTRSHGVSVLPGPKEFRPGPLASPDTVARMLEVVAQTYTHAIIDIPSSLDREDFQLVNGVAASIVVVVTPELPALWRSERLLRFLATCGATEKVRLVINRALKSDEISDSQVEKVLKHPVYWKLPNNYKGCINAINSGRPLVSDNHSELSRSYRQLTCRLTGVELPEKRRGLFGYFS